MSAQKLEATSATETLRRRRVTPIQRARRALHRHPEISPFIVLIMVLAAFALASPRFLQPSNLSLILQQVTIIGSLAMGQTLVILTAGIDMSVGAIMILVSIIIGALAGYVGLPGLGVAFPRALRGNGRRIREWFPGCLCRASAFHRDTRYAQRLHRDLPPHQWRPFHSRCQTRLLPQLDECLSANRAIPNDDRSPSRDNHVPNRRVHPVANQMGKIRLRGGWRCLGGSTRRYSSQTASHQRLQRCRLIFAVSAWVLIGRIGAATPTVAVDSNLDSITAVVIGGTSLFGGRGNLFGTFLGAVIVGAVRDGLALARLDVLYQTSAIGLLIIASVSLDRWIRKVQAFR